MNKDLDELLSKYFNLEFDLAGGLDPRLSLTRKELVEEIQAYITKASTLRAIEELEAIKMNTGYTINDFYPAINERLKQLKGEQ